jgi:hypothetical protein
MRAGAYRDDDFGRDIIRLLIECMGGGLRFGLKGLIRWY